MRGKRRGDHRLLGRHHVEVPGLVRDEIRLPTARSTRLGALLLLVRAKVLLGRLGGGLRGDMG